MGNAHRQFACSYADVSVDDKLSRAQSIIMQGIHSILCAPLMIGNAVVGVLYVDYLFTQRSITEDDVRLSRRSDASRRSSSKRRACARKRFRSGSWTKS